MKVSIVDATPAVENEETKMDMISGLLAEQVQVDTDFDTYEDPLHPDELTLLWQFTVFYDGSSLYTLDHPTRFAVSELNDATMPDENELEKMLKVSHNSLKEAVENKTAFLPGFIKVEDFSTVDVFEHAQKIKRLLAMIAERHNPAPGP